MNLILSHRIIPNPKPDDAGMITVKAVVFGYDPFTASTSVKDFIEEDDECPCKERLNYFLMESEMNDDDISDVLIKLVLYVCDVTSSPSYTNSSGCALNVWLHVPLPSPEIDPEVDEAIEVSYPVSNYIRLEEFNKGRRDLTLPCGHKFDEECVLKWFETSHVCPLCRFEVPCEDRRRQSSYENEDYI